MDGIDMKTPIITLAMLFSNLAFAHYESPENDCQENVEKILTIYESLEEGSEQELMLRDKVIQAKEDVGNKKYCYIYENLIR